MFLNWGMLISSPVEENPQFKFLEEWVRSKDGVELYVRLFNDFQSHQTTTQLTLIMATLVNYLRLYPDSKDKLDRIITGNYVTKLNDYLCGISIGNIGRVMERMAISLSRVLKSSGDKFENLLIFLESVLDLEHPPLEIFDGFSEVAYMGFRVNGLSHETAIANLVPIKSPKLRSKDDLRVGTTQSKELTSKILGPLEYGQF